MKPDSIFITPAGLKHLKQARASLQKQIEKAAAMLREAYAAGDEDSVAMALCQFQQLEAKRAQLTATLLQAKMLQRHPSHTIELGSTIRLATDAGIRHFTIVNSAEADPSANRISPESPLGHSLLHHRSGDNVTVNTLGKALKFHILHVE